MTDTQTLLQERLCMPKLSCLARGMSKCNKIHGSIVLQTETRSYGWSYKTLTQTWLYEFSFNICSPNPTLHGQLSTFVKSVNTCFLKNLCAFTCVHYSTVGHFTCVAFGGREHDRVSAVVGDSVHSRKTSALLCWESGADRASVHWLIHNHFRLHQQILMERTVLEFGHGSYSWRIKKVHFHNVLKVQGSRFKVLYHLSHTQSYRV